MLGKNHISQQHVKIFFCMIENTLYGVLLIHNELWIYGGNKTEISAKLDQVT